jgi:ribosomal protein S18 acetylase RimI-like enzyme
MTSVEIIGFRNELAKYFTELNLAWIKKYFEVEPMDEKILSDPKANIIARGVHIYFARLGEKIAGTFALLKISSGIYELSKMAVAESLQGKNIGNAMIRFCIKEAQRLNIDRLVLYSNTKSKPAIHLYEKYGFKEVPLENSEYKRSNIKMEIIFKQYA